MKDFIHRLDDKAESDLSSILGKLNVGFYFPEAWVSVNREGIDVSSVSIPTGKHRFVIITNGWSDTVNDFIDIYNLAISVDDRPRDIVAIRDENGSSGWAFDHVSTINTYDWTIIENISIYESSLVGKHESVICDRALLFKYAKGQILISTGGTLPDRLWINHKPNAISEILLPLTLRKELSA